MVGLAGAGAGGAETPRAQDSVSSIFPGSVETALLERLSPGRRRRSSGIRRAQRPTRSLLDALAVRGRRAEAVVDGGHAVAGSAWN